MADRTAIKKNLRYLRLIIYAVVLGYIWIQYEFSSGNWSYSNGQPKINGQHINGKDEGTWTWFYQNGKKQMQGEFLHGKRFGVWTIWDSTGNKISENHYENDKLNGAFVRWYSNGKIESEGVCKDDQLVHTTHYTTDGTAK